MQDEGTGVAVHALEKAFGELRKALAAVQVESAPAQASAPGVSTEDLSRLAFTPDEAAKVLGLPGAWTVRRLIKAQKLRARSTGARYIIPGSAIIEFLNGTDAPMSAGGAA